MISNKIRIGLIVSFSFFSIFSCRPKAQNPDAPAPIITDITLDEAMELVAAEKDLVIIDVRTPEEIAEGKIFDQAMEMDYYGDFKKEVASLDTLGQYLLYCRSGKRSAKAAKIMKDQGFKDIKNLLGGYNNWADQNNK